MNKLTSFAVFIFFFSTAYSQQDLLVFKKGNKGIDRYWKGSVISFQLKNRQWQKGEITKIQNDSFFIRPMVVRFSLMSTDSFHLKVMGFALTDVFAMPKKGVLIDYIDGRFQISTSGGHVHFYWIKSGWIFRVGAAGYAGLHIANGLINNNFSFQESKTELAAAAAVFLFGVLLHKTYKPYLQLGRKYSLEIVKLSN